MQERWLENIDDYLSGRLNPEERKQFEAEMASNEELALFKLYQAIEKEMTEGERFSLEESKLKASLDELGKNYFINNAQQGRK